MQKTSGGSSEEQTHFFSRLVAVIGIIFALMFAIVWTIFYLYRKCERLHFAYTRAKHGLKNKDVLDIDPDGSGDEAFAENETADEKDEE